MNGFRVCLPRHKKTNCRVINFANFVQFKAKFYLFISFSRYELTKN